MAQVGYATLAVVPAMAGFGKKLSSGINPELDRAGKDGSKRFGDSMSSSAKQHGARVGKVLGIGILSGLTLAVAGVGAVLKTGFDESMDASAGMAQLAAGIKSTGNAANVTVPGMETLATKIQNYSGQTDDSIVATEQLLLTFTNIRNSGSDKIFDLTTIAAADMAAKLGGDAAGSAIQLGKALNDPVKGVTALQRVGVSFTAAQKKQIAALVKTGDTVGAQKIILHELNTEFGGAAQAAGKSLPGQLAIAKRSFEDLSQTVVTALMPAFSTAMTGINSFVKDVQSSFEKGGLGQVFTDLGAKIAAAWPAVQAQLGRWAVAFWAWIEPMIPPMLVKLGNVLAALGTWIVTVGVPKLGKWIGSWASAFWAWIEPMIVPFLGKMGVLLIRFETWAYTVALPAIVKKLGEWATAFAAWVPGATTAMITKLGVLLKAFTDWFTITALPAIVKKLGEWATAFAAWVGPAWVKLQTALGTFISKFASWIAFTALPTIRTNLAQWGVAFAAWIPGATVKMIIGLNLLKLRMSRWIVVEATPTIAGNLVRWRLAFLGWITDTIRSLPANLALLLGVLTAWAVKVPGWISTKLGNLTYVLVTKGAQLLAGLLDGIKAAPEKIRQAINAVGANIVTAVKNFFGIHSPSTVMAGLGGHIITGLIQGIIKNKGQVGSLIKSVFGDVKGGIGGIIGWLSSQGGGLLESVLGGAGNLGKVFGGALGGLFGGGGGGAVSRWSGVVLQALSALGQPAALLGTVLRLINKESSGDPNSVNTWDINAKNGTPSMGLIQTIMPTFLQWAGPFASLGPLNPFANIYAGLRHAIAAWGSIAAVDPLVHAGGYAFGTNSAAPGYAWVGERGPELVKFKGGESVAPASKLNPRLPGGNGATSADLLVEVKGLRADIRALPKTYQMGQRQYA